MKLIYLYLLLLIIPLGAFAQGNKMLLTGNVVMSGDGTTPYLVSLTVSGKDVTGYSITDYQKNELKAAVVGKFDAAGNLFIKETNSMDDANSILAGTYCFFTGSLKVSVKNGRKSYSGQFVSRRLNGESCGVGTMTITDVTPQVKAIPAPPKPRVVSASKPTLNTPRIIAAVDTLPLAPPAAPKPPSPPVKDTPPAVAATPPADIPAKPKPDLSTYHPLYHWKGDNLTFDIWDGFTEDGDIVKIEINDEVLDKSYRLTKEKKRFATTLVAGKVNKVTITLLSEGTEPIVTGLVTFFDGEKEVPLSVEGKPGQIANIYFVQDK